MKKISILLMLMSFYSGFSQELKLNEDTKFYEFFKIVESIDTSIKSKFLLRFKQINIKDIQDIDEQISGNTMTSHLVMASVPVEIYYKVKVDFKSGKYKLTITNFVLKDHNGAVPLEDLGAYKNVWIKKINKKLPDIITNLENINTKSDW